MKILYCALVILCWPAFGYIDPGTGSSFFSLLGWIVAGFSAFFGLAMGLAGGLWMRGKKTFRGVFSGAFGSFFSKHKRNTLSVFLGLTIAAGIGGGFFL